MRVVTIGSGICGLTFAAAMRLINRDVEVQIYECDTAPDARFQGYSLGMKGGAGIPVLRRLGVFDRLQPNMFPVYNFVFCNQMGNPLLELPSSTDDKNLNLRIKRSLLRGALARLRPTSPSILAWNAPGIDTRMMGLTCCFETASRCEPITSWPRMASVRLRVRSWSAMRSSTSALPVW